jgi:hypothetical protein
MVNTRLDLHYRQHVEKLLSPPASRKQHSDAFRDIASGTEDLYDVSLNYLDIKLDTTTEAEGG